ncbi:MAG: tRNA (guanosine(37)-N1)-methyltransferase TrmD [Patescibacteria group bacterium]|nr:tRNA (guanosine(37)-N1)-methyltransferase TrmD [Patescibacteria group bacterium]
MKVDILTLFPELFVPFLEWSMIKKARQIGAVEIKIHSLRKWAIDKRGTVDDHPYGGGPGMILRIEPIFNAIEEIRSTPTTSEGKLHPRGAKTHPGGVVALLSPKGKTFTQKMAGELADLDQVVLICGHYEGVDERVRKHLIDEEISIGDYVLSGGEIPAMTVIDAITRLLPNVLEKEGASEIESFSPGLKKMLIENNDKFKMINEKIMIEFPQYTRPESFQGWKVPKVLLSGNHGKINLWRAKKVKIKK